MTLRLGFVGFEVFVGGGASPDDEPAEAGGPRLGRGPRARCAELAAGNCGRRLGVGFGRGGGGMEDTGAAGAGGSSEREKLGTGWAGSDGVALGVVCSSLSTVGSRITGGGGGGIAALSRALRLTTLEASATSVAVASAALFDVHDDPWDTPSSGCFGVSF